MKHADNKIMLSGFAVCHYTSHRRCLDTILALCTGADATSTHTKVGVGPKILSIT